MSVKKIFYIILGLISVALGAIGTAFPILPTVPFLLLATFCFAKSSERLNRWFFGTKLYQDNLETFLKGRGMTKTAKIRIITIVTITMAIGFLLMKNVPAGRVLLAVVWVFHLIYFRFGVRTISEEEAVRIKIEEHADVTE